MASIASTTEQQIDTRDDFAGLGSAVLNVLGSLKLTVALFAFSLILVLVGTLAQDEMNMLDVKQRYFLSWVAMLHLDDFVPQAFYQHDQPLPGVIPFPGGALIGMLLMVNLLAAKVTRFKIHTSGTTLMTGIGFLIAGAAVAALIIATGHNSDGLQGNPPMQYTTLWGMVLAAMGLGSFALIVNGVRTTNPMTRILCIVPAVILAGLVIFSLASGFRIGDPGLRIVWQLTKGLGAGIILLIGCLLVFDRQGGNVLIHMGVGLLMVGQFVFGDRQLEQRLSLVEGQSANTFVNLDEVELTFIENTEDQQHVTAVPASRLQAAEELKETISDESLPVDIKVLAFYENSSIEDVTDENMATKGIGLEIQAVARPKIGGTDSRINMPAAYVEFLDKESGESLGRHLVSQIHSDRELLIPGADAKNMFDEVAAGGKTYDVGLRYHREVKPYWVQLEDVRRVNYSGTDTPRDYSSFVRIIDPETGDDRKERIWMNNPLRYRGETFFQSNYTPLPGGKEMTGIQVVRNSGWLIPYVACSITALGMFVHFWGTLTRFLKRRVRENNRPDADPFETAKLEKSNKPVIATVVGFAVLAIYMLVPWSAVMNSRRASERSQAFDLYEAGKIPVQFGGRVMPLDAYARQTLKAISNKESLSLEEAPKVIADRAGGKKLSAMQWLMEVAIDEPELTKLRMFRIDAEEVRSELELNRRKSKLYSLEEIFKNWNRVDQLVRVARQKEASELSFKEKKLIEIDGRTRNYTMSRAAFQLPAAPHLSPEKFVSQLPPQLREQFENLPESTRQSLMMQAAMGELEQQMDALREMTAPAIIPPTQSVVDRAVDQPEWEAFSPAFFDSVKAEITESDAVKKPGVDSFGKMIAAYNDDDKLAFNEAVDDHISEVNSYAVPGYKPGLVSLERWMQSNWPTGVAMILYLISMVLCIVYFAVNLPRLRRAVWGVLAIALAIHTIAIVCRIAITGRAPVINIYSSAVFVGWAAVLFGLVVERLFRYGTGNMLSATAGTLTLLVAYGLNTGDSMPVLQAVLDTQFWLATHVISVTLGYVATMVAGLLGIGYLIANWIGKDDKSLRDLYRCCYGAACFGILFSFVGTVLGGLWADDSWGRFWGWDPKENGALLIVIWNALMLHARWDGMVAARGFSILAIGGNIVTAWSWFGTNELGIGLHSYGFTSGVLMWLTVFIAVQVAFIVAGLLFRTRPPNPAT
tara:strand:+ start:237239 stop:240868 length:3630 start_codon:yes stop_codon:yes gene_type:complete